MKYIEPIKSIMLLLLVSLSLVLTFVIWTYTPDYKFMEKTEDEKVAITIGPKKRMDDVIMPYKAVYRADNKWSGTVSNTVMRDLMDAFGEWDDLNLIQVNNNLKAEQLNEMTRINNRITIFFSGEVPFSSFSFILPFTNNDLPETTFNRIIIDWEKYDNKELQLYFVGANNTTLYSSHVRIPNAKQFMDDIIEPSKKYGEFKEVQRDGFSSLYVPDDKIESVKYTYYIGEPSPDLFKDVLFSDPNVVKRTVDSASTEKYTDGMSLMTIDTQLKSLNYVYPAAESGNRIPPSKMLKDSFEFINEHGGLTSDYRYASMNTTKNQIDYQLFLQGLPVYSDQTITRITTVWGDNRIFRYIRPYYSLDMDITSEKESKELPSGTEMIEKVHHMKKFVLSDFEDIVVGYYLTQNENQQLFTLEPCWFLLRKGGWVRLTPGKQGGAENGLE